MVLKAVIFDLDGLTVDSEPVYRRAWQRAAAELGIALSQADYERAFVGRSNADCDREVARLYPDCDLAALRAARDQHWHHLVTTEGMPLRPGVEALLSWLEGAAIPRVIATASSRQEATASLTAAGLSQRFAVILTADDVTHTKPAPEVYLKAVAKLGQVPEHCLALEDSVNGATAAIAAGLRTIIVPDLQTPTPELAAQAYRVVPSLSVALPLIQALVYSQLGH